MAAAAPRHAAGLLLAAVALCALASCTVAQQQDPFNSTGWNVGGFTIVSNVTGHLALSRDACDIARAIHPVDYTANITAIAHIYLNGRNAVRCGRLQQGATWHGVMGVTFPFLAGCSTAAAGSTGSLCLDDMHLPPNAQPATSPA